MQEVFLLVAPPMHTGISNPKDDSYVIFAMHIGENHSAELIRCMDTWYERVDRIIKGGPVPSRSGDVVAAFIKMDSRTM